MKRGGLSISNCNTENNEASSALISYSGERLEHNTNNHWLDALPPEPQTEGKNKIQINMNMDSAVCKSYFTCSYTETYVCYSLKGLSLSFYPSFSIAWKKGVKTQDVLLTTLQGSTMRFKWRKCSHVDSRWAGSQELTCLFHSILSA